MTTFPSFPRSLAIGAGALALLVAGGCSTEPTLDDTGAIEALTVPLESVSSAAEALPTDGYYSIQRDYRRCAAPFCGGFFITALNDVDACPEVAQRAEGRCYVADIEAFSPLEGGDVVHVSSFDPSPFAEEPFLIASVDAVYALVLEDADTTGTRLVFNDEDGIRTVARVNTKLSGTPHTILASASADEIDLLVDAYKENWALGGALTEGFVLGRQTYVVTNVWAAKRPVEPQNYCVFLDTEDALTAWNASTLEQAEGIAGDTSATIDPGFCADLNQVCPEIYEPIYGRIDAISDECTEFSNNCVFTAAVLRAAGGAEEPSKAQGTYCNPPPPVCVVADRLEEQSYSAWNFASREAAEGLIAGLEGQGAEVTVYEGYCADQRLFCTLEFMPVNGTIDALGDEVCIDAGNRCEFRSEVIAAAGGIENPSKATGVYEEGLCSEEPAECDDTLICGQATTCIDGQLYPTTCGPANCDEPIGEC